MPSSVAFPVAPSAYALFVLVDAGLDDVAREQYDM